MNRRPLRTVWILALCSILAWRVQAVSPTQNALPQTNGPGDMFCGPRCVQYILKYYGKDEDLIDLVRETQWPNLEQGASLQSLDIALRKRGVHTSALRLKSINTLRWPYPVLLHLKGQNGGGHYIVWLPCSSADQATVWVGLDGQETGATRQLAQRCSGRILLTAPTSITRLEGVDGGFGFFPTLAVVSNSIVFTFVAVRWFLRHKAHAGSSEQITTPDKEEAHEISNENARRPLRCDRVPVDRSRHQ